MRRPDPSGRFPPPERAARSRRGLGTPVFLLLGLAAAPPPPPALAPGLRVEERLADGMTRSYPVRLAAGDFLRAVVTEEGADVAVRLFSPAHREVAYVDGPRFPVEDEDLAAVAPAAGLYHLEVSRGSGGQRRAGYLLRVTDLRPAGERDRQRAAAVALTQRAVGQMALQSDAGWRRQLATRESALALWRSLGDTRRAAVELLEMGNLRYLLQEYGPAADLFHQSIAGFRAAGDAGGLADALNEAGRADRRLWRSGEAIAHLEEALPLARAGADPKLAANVLDNLGNVEADLGRPRQALGLIDESRRLAHRAGNAEGEARALENEGSAYADLGERQSALACYRDALAIAERGGLAEQQAAAWNNLGDSHVVLGQWDEAEREHRRALALFQARGDGQAEARSRNQLALVERHLGRYAAAAADLRRAIDLGHRYADPSAEATALADLAYVDLERDLVARARGDAEAARRVAPPGGEAEMSALIALGDARRVGGDLPGAAAALRDAVALCRRRGNRANEAGATLLLAEVARDGGQLRRTAELTRGAIEIVESLRTRVASEELRASFLASSQWYYAFAVDTAMALERAHPGEGWAARALTLAERAKARSLIEILAAAGAEPAQRGEPRLAADERRAREAVSAAELRRLEMLRQEPPPAATAVAAAGRSYDAALAAYERIEREVADRSPGYASLTSPEPLSAAQIEGQVLDRATLLLEIALGERRSFLWVVSAGGLASYELPGRQAVEAAARRYYDLVTAPNAAPPGEGAAGRTARLAAARRDLPAAAAALSRTVLGPAAARLGSYRLAIVADGLLQYVPFAALPDPAAAAGGRPLIDGHEVVVLPSASALAVLRRELAGRPAAAKTLALVADPVFSRDDPRVELGTRGRQPGAAAAALTTTAAAPARGGDDCGGEAGLARLHFSAAEARSIFALVPAADRLVATGFAASRPTVLSGKLGSYRIVHFATHGCVDSRHPDLSSLVLSLVDARGAPQNGFLRLGDIYRLDLRADLVVLSACRTALGQEVRGEGLIGLTRGFMHAGAARVVASLWSVDDRATAELMARFYRGMLAAKLTPAAALRAAQRSMARDAAWSSPYDWAGFSLEGEWR